VLSSGGEAKARKRKRQGLTMTFKGLPPMTGRPPTRPYPLKSLPSPSSTKLGTKPLTHRPWDISGLNESRWVGFKDSTIRKKTINILYPACVLWMLVQVT
jgi:hypothetical protein